MDALLFMTAWCAFPFLWYAILRHTEFSFRVLSIPLLLLVSLVAFQYIGLPVLYFGLDPYRAHAVSDPSILFRVFFYTAITITLICAGISLASLHWKRPGWEVGELQEPCRLGWMKIGLFLLVFLSISVFAIYLYLVGPQTNAFLIAAGFVESDLSVMEARSAMTNGFEGKYHWYKLFMHDFLVFGSCSWFAWILLNRENGARSWSLLGILVGVTTFSMVVTGEKAPVAEYAVCLFLVYVLCHDRGGIKLWRIVGLSVFLVVILSGLYILMAGSDRFLPSISLVFSRTFTCPIQPAYHYLEFFPREHEFLLGRSFPNPRGLFPFEPYHLTVEIMRWLHPEEAASGVVGTAPTVFWGEMYANFGTWGVLVPPLFLGYAFYAMQVVFEKLTFTPFVVALFVWFAMHYKNLAQTSLCNYILDTYVAGIVMAFLVLTLLAGWPLLRKGECLPESPRGMPPDRREG